MCSIFHIIFFAITIVYCSVFSHPLRNESRSVLLGRWRRQAGYIYDRPKTPFQLPPPPSPAGPVNTPEQSGYAYTAGTVGTTPQAVSIGYSKGITSGGSGYTSQTNVGSTGSYNSDSQSTASIGSAGGGYGSAGGGYGSAGGVVGSTGGGTGSTSGGYGSTAGVVGNTGGGYGSTTAVVSSTSGGIGITSTGASTGYNYATETTVGQTPSRPRPSTNAPTYLPPSLVPSGMGEISVTSTTGRPTVTTSGGTVTSGSTPGPTPTDLYLPPPTPGSTASVTVVSSTPAAAYVPPVSTPASTATSMVSTPAPTYLPPFL